ncbi:Uncharacterised protein [Mycobacterium tuberculosis]|uniref:Uncharacterized protein n=1 Tax=Mycobacterium tuberculosis TaxID=1773 RepID=A0A655FB79_MYCTX|nr:Uncharacterised protein [Mycobacterium tuberculosis]CNV59020.1 Uncharacterised protein [Mycobacterium tuberculosis]
MFQQVVDLVDWNAGFGGELLIGGFATQMLVHLPLDPRQLVDLLNQVYGQADGAALVGHSAGDGLADPPRGIR